MEPVGINTNLQPRRILFAKCPRILLSGCGALGVFGLGVYRIQGFRGSGFSGCRLSGLPRFERHFSV